MQFLRVLSYNIQALPIPFFMDHSRYRKIGEALGNRRTAGTAPHVVALQEAFHSRTDELVEAAGYPYVSYGPQSKGLKLRSGLVILSEFPILEQDHFVFTKNIRWDRLVRKAIQYVQVELPALKLRADIFNLHLASPDADFNARVKPREAIYVRSWQIRQVSRLVRQKSSDDRICLIPGDFNFRPHDRDAEWLMRRVGVQHSGVAMLNSKSCREVDSVHHDLKHSDDHQFYRHPEGHSWLHPVKLRRTFSGTDEKQLSDHTGLEVDYHFGDRS